MAILSFLNIAAIFVFKFWINGSKKIQNQHPFKKRPPKRPRNTYIIFTHLLQIFIKNAWKRLDNFLVYTQKDMSGSAEHLWCAHYGPASQSVMRARALARNKNYVL
jgi:hypothetical protein